MIGFSLFSILSILGLWSTFGSPSLHSVRAVAPLDLTPIASGTVNFDPKTTGIAIPAALGTRISVAFTGGELKDVNGTRIGNVVSGSETGLVDASGLIHIDARASWALTDGSYLFGAFQGIGVVFQENHVYVTFETNSTTYAAWNKLFITGRSTIANNTLTFDLFTPL